MITIAEQATIGCFFVDCVMVVLDTEAALLDRVLPLIGEVGELVAPKTFRWSLWSRSFFIRCSGLVIPKQ